MALLNGQPRADRQFCHQNEMDKTPALPQKPQKALIFNL
jgi:hypothetical protein